MITLTLTESEVRELEAALSRVIGGIRPEDCPFSDPVLVRHRRNAAEIALAKCAKALGRDNVLINDSRGCPSCGTLGDPLDC